MMVCEFVSWDDVSIPNCFWKVIRAMFQSPPTSICYPPVCWNLAINNLPFVDVFSSKKRHLYGLFVRGFPGLPRLMIFRFNRWMFFSTIEDMYIKGIKRYQLANCSSSHHFPPSAAISPYFLGINNRDYVNLPPTEKHDAVIWAWPLTFFSWSASERSKFAKQCIASTASTSSGRKKNHGQTSTIFRLKMLPKTCVISAIEVRSSLSNLTNKGDGSAPGLAEGFWSTQFCCEYQNPRYNYTCCVSMCI